MSGNYIGPVLPPGFILPSHENEIPLDSDEEDGSSAEDSHSTPGSSNENSTYGPALPPGLFESNIIGPTLPPQFVKSKSEQSQISDSEEDDMIGPLACEASSGNDGLLEGAEVIEMRSQKMKEKLLNKSLGNDAAPAREEWMTELPTNLVRKIGLGPRTFNRRAPTSALKEDRSGWTDTPSDKEKKDKQPEVKKGPDANELQVQARNREMAAQLEKYNKSKRKESLLDLHKSKRKKNAEKDASKAKMRQEFDRDKDLGISRLDPLKAKRVIDGAKVLNGRFSHGSSQFL